MIRKIALKQYYILLILAMAAIAAIVWFYFTPNKKLDIAASQIESTVEQIRKNFAHKANYWGLSTKYLIDNNILTNLSYGNGQLLNALGKRVEIGQDENGTAVMPGERNFVVAYTNLSVGECLAVATYRFKHPEELGLLNITIINKDNRQSFDWGEGDYKLPLTRQKAKKFCKNDSIVLWTLE